LAALPEVRRIYTAAIEGNFGAKSMQAAHDFEQSSIALVNITP
jgi:hypothetical protein